MVMRSFATKEMCLHIEGKVDDIKKQLHAEIREILKIFISEDGKEICIRGDLHDYRVRNKIIRIVSGGKHGVDLQTD
ncbi:MAG: hypothetical protein KAU14_07330 [Thermoplasmata archaeon]|nr:hypothetical protein [Thermoplasmata archaeon]